MIDNQASGEVTKEEGKDRGSGGVSVTVNG